MNPLKRPNPGWTAVADLGTNTFQLMIGRVNEGMLETKFRFKTGVQIGKGGMAKKMIQPEALQRAMDTLRYFKDVLEQHHIHPRDCILLGTSAFRNAQNRDEVQNAIRIQTGFEVRIISGELEAELIFLGVMASQVIKDEEIALILDIGGGSVEFIICQGKNLLWRHSFEIGGLRLMEKFHQSDPISPPMQSALVQFLEIELAPLKAVIQTFNPTILVGCSGSFDTLIEMAQASKNEKIDNIEAQPKYQLALPDFEILSQKLIAANRAQRLAMPGMIELRVDMMPVAVILIQHILSFLTNPQIRVSTYSLKEGAFYHPFPKL